MVMTTDNSEFQGFPTHPPSLDDVFRSSPEPPGSYYRCPVSTPLNPGKRQPQQKVPESLTFVSLDFNKVQNDVKPNIHRGLPAGRKILPRRKNMDFYYVDKDFQRRIAAQSNTTWLRSLCAQPVDEIFTKYRSLNEVKKQQDVMSRGFTTPGEKAIYDAWETNASRGHSSSDSRTTLLSRATTVSLSPQLTVVSKSYRRANTVLGSIPRHNNAVNSSASLSPSESGIATPMVSRASPSQMNRKKTDKKVKEKESVVDQSFYDQFKRQMPRLPKVENNSNRTRKIIISNDNSSNVFTFDQPTLTPISNSVSPKKHQLSASTNSNFSLFGINEKDNT